MPRKKLIRTNELVYHITSRSNSKEWFNIPQEECWRIFCDELFCAYKNYKLETHAYVLMNNHYHLMARTPESNIDKVMYSINKNMAQKINMSTGRINHVFGGPYHWSLITSERYYFYATKYLYQNPVRAKICKNVEDYPYSSLKHKHEYFPLSPYEGYELVQLNDIFNKEESSQIRKGLKKEKFQPSYNPSTRRRSL